MNEFANRARASLWWMVPLVVALALIAWETNFGRTMRPLPPPEAPVEPKPVVTALLPEFAIPGGAAARGETVQRTLFNPTRRPAPVLAVDATKARMQRGQFALTGTMVVGGKNTAFLRETAGGRARRVLQGETINGLLVAEVKADRVRLALGDESEELVLRVVPNPKPTVGQVPVPAPVAPAIPATAAAGAPTAQPGVAAPANVGSGAEASLAERRRAARAAQAAIQAQNSTPDGNPRPANPNGVAPAPVAPAVSPAPAPAAGAAAAPDPRWLDVYRQYQTRSPNVTK